MLFYMVARVMVAKRHSGKRRNLRIVYIVSNACNTILRAIMVAKKNIFKLRTLLTYSGEAG